MTAPEIRSSITSALKRCPLPATAIAETLDEDLTEVYAVLAKMEGDGTVRVLSCGRMREWELMAS